MKNFIFKVWDGNDIVESLTLPFALDFRAKEFATLLQMDRSWHTRNICQVTWETETFSQRTNNPEYAK